MNVDQLVAWEPNSLPLPCLMTEAPVEIKPPKVEVRLQVVVDDDFPKGEVVKYFPHQGYGYIKDRVAREVFFSLKETDLVGEKGKADLRQGDIVGYDLTHTNRGLRVKKMKIY